MRFTSFALAAFSMGSAFAAPAVQQQQPHARALEVLGTATTTVNTVKTTVEGELQSISKLIVDVNVDTATLVPQLEKSLLSIVGEVNKIVGTVLPIVTEGVPTLLEDELKGLPDLLKGVLSIASGLQSTAEEIVNGVSADVLKAVKPELQLVLSTVEPIAKPIVTLALSAVGDITGPVVSEVQSLVKDLEKIAGGILKPVTDLVDKIL